MPIEAIRNKPTGQKISIEKFQAMIKESLAKAIRIRLHNVDCIQSSVEDELGLPVDSLVFDHLHLGVTDKVAEVVDQRFLTNKLHYQAVPLLEQVAARVSVYQSRKKSISIAIDKPLERTGLSAPRAFIHHVGFVLKPTANTTFDQLLGQAETNKASITSDGALEITREGLPKILFKLMGIGRNHNAGLIEILAKSPMDVFAIKKS